MIKNLTDSGVVRLISGGGICQCCTSDVMFSFDRFGKPFNAKDESFCKRACCGTSANRKRLMVKTYDYDGKPGYCGDESSELHKCAVRIASSLGLIDES